MPRLMIACALAALLCPLCRAACSGDTCADETSLLQVEKSIKRASERWEDQQPPRSLQENPKLHHAGAEEMSEGELPEVLKHAADEDRAAIKKAKTEREGKDLAAKKSTKKEQSKKGSEDSTDEDTLKEVSAAMKKADSKTKTSEDSADTKKKSSDEDKADTKKKASTAKKTTADETPAKKTAAEEKSKKIIPAKETPAQDKKVASSTASKAKDIKNPSTQDMDASTASKAKDIKNPSTQDMAATKTEVMSGQAKADYDELSAMASEEQEATTKEVAYLKKAEMAQRASQKAARDAVDAMKEATKTQVQASKWNDAAASEHDFFEKIQKEEKAALEKQHATDELDAARAVLKAKGMEKDAAKAEVLKATQIKAEKERTALAAAGSTGVSLATEHIAMAKSEEDDHHLASYEKSVEETKDWADWAWNA